MASVKMLTRNTGLVLTMIAITVLSISCRAGDESAISLDDIARFATETMQKKKKHRPINKTQITLLTFIAGA